MRLRVPLTNHLQREACFAEGFDYLVPDFEGRERNARGDDGMDVATHGAVASMHDAQCLTEDAPYRPPPTSMNGSYGSMDGVVKEDGDAVGGGDAEAEMGQAGDEGIDPLKHLMTLTGHGHEIGIVYLEHMTAMGLTGDDKLLDAGQEGKQATPVLGYVVRVVTRIGSTVESGIAALAHTAMAGGAEGNYAAS